MISIVNTIFNLYTVDNKNSFKKNSIKNLTLFLTLTVFFLRLLTNLLPYSGKTFTFLTSPTFNPSR